jgi:hypothetical protein
LLGIWKNYEELEESMSLDELLVTIDASRKRAKEEHRFLAAIQGVDIGESSGDGPQQLNITDIAHDTRSEGFGVGVGLGHAIQTVQVESVGA